MSSVVIVDYGLGNLRSVEGAVDRVGHQPIVSSNRDQILAAPKLILPGVGAFGDGMAKLRERGLVEALNIAVHERRTPVLGICLGAQLMARESEEFGHHAGLAWLPATVRRIEPADPSLRIPHVGWNELRQTRDDELFEGVPQDALFYFVHSYHVCPDSSELVAATCDYGGTVAAVFRKDNIFGTQFHPEKSQRHGLRLLENFLNA